MLMVLLNMLLAIIMDTYAAVNAPGAETIWTQIREALHTARETRGHLDLWYLICEFEDDDYNTHADRVTSKSLRSAFETQKMTKHNSDYLIRKTAEFVKAKEAKTELKMSDAVRIISRMQTTGLRVQENSDRILEMLIEDRRRPQEERFDAIMAGQDPDEKHPRQPHRGLPGAAVYNAAPAVNNFTRPAFGTGPGTASAGAAVGNNAQAAPLPGQLPGQVATVQRRVSQLTEVNSRRASSLSLSNFPNIPTRPVHATGGFAAGADEQIQGTLEQLQTTLDGILSDQLRIESSIQEEIRDLRVYVEQRDSWLETHLNDVNRRFEKVERATDRMTAAMQGFDFKALMGETERVAHYLGLQHKGMWQPATGGSSPQRLLKADTDAGSPSGVRRSSYSEDGDEPGAQDEYEDMEGDVGQTGEALVVAEAREPAGNGMSLAARKHMTQQLERIEQQVQQLVSHTEESVEARRLLWKIDLNVRQTRTSVQKIEEHGLRQPESKVVPKASHAEGFAKHLSMRSSQSNVTNQLSVPNPNTGGGGGGVGSGLRLPAVPDNRSEHSGG